MRFGCLEQNVEALYTPLKMEKYSERNAVIF